MTINKRHTITLDEIIAFELTCKNCSITSTIPVGNKMELTGECPHCKAHWLFGISKALEHLKAGISEVVTHSQDKDVGCTLAVEIKGEDDREEKD